MQHIADIRYQLRVITIIAMYIHSMPSQESVLICDKRAARVSASNLVLVCVHLHLYMQYSIYIPRSPGPDAQGKVILG